MIRIDDDYIEYVKDYWFPGSSLLPLKINNPYFQSMEMIINKKDISNIEDIIYNTLGNWKDHIICQSPMTEVIGLRLKSSWLQ
jgi:hypothetical protein